MEEELELQDLNSPQSSKTFMKRDNKVGSPPHTSKLSAGGDGNNITNLFLIKHHLDQKPHTSTLLKKHDKDFSQKSDTISETPEISQISEELSQIGRRASVDSHSKADSKSYRDRVKSRFQMIKENVGKSTHKASFKDATKKLMMEKIRQENDAIDSEIERKRKLLGVANLDGKKKLDFFIGRNGYSERLKDMKKSSEIHNEAEIFNKSTEQLIDEPLQEDCLIEMKYPENLRSQEKSSELEFLFRPSGKAIGLSEKLVDREPIYLEDEGFFVPSRPNIPRRYINKLEERLLINEDRKFFNVQGELDILESPITHSSIRPAEYQDMDNTLTVFTEPILNDTECQEILVIKENILQVNIKNIIFNHHPLFSFEHVLARQLKRMVEEYEKYQSHHILKKMFNRLEASRHILTHSEETGNAKKEQISKYKKDIKELRETLFIQGREERKLLKSILTMWKNIKKLRSRNGYTTTNVKLIINKESQNLEADKNHWDENIQKTYQEILKEYREEFKNKMRNYKKAVEEYQNSPRSETMDDSPKKPTYNVDEDAVFKQVKSKFQESFRSPGEPMIRFKLNESVAISTEVENLQEMPRRNLVASTKILLKVICNELTVCKTKSISLGNNFECYINEKISILLTNVPKYIKIVLIEQTNILHKDSFIEINLNVPPQSTSKSNCNFGRQEFQKWSSIRYKHEGVGSGVSILELLKKNNLDIPVDFEDFKLHTNGTIQYQSFWENSKVKENYDGTVIDDALEAIIDKNGSIQIDKLGEWINRTKPDPQNPKNSVLFEYVQGFSDDLTALKINKYFRLNPHQESLKFCDTSLIDDNLRMKILQLRNQNEPEFDGMVVPNRIKEIPTNILKDYKRRIANEREGLFIEEAKVEGYDSKRRNGSRIMKQIHTKIFQKCKNSTNNLELEDILDEKYLVYLERFIKTSTINFFNWFRWKPQLNQPLPELKKRNVEKIDSNVQELSSLVKISVKVLGGLNVPYRDLSVLKNRRSFDDQTLAKNRVKSFVEVRYNEIFDRTKAVEGTQPIWNEELALILSPSHFDYLNPNSLGGCISLNVFDELDQNNENEEEKSRNWLGSLEIPLSAICSSNGMSGHFKLSTPNVLFGYVKDDNSSSNSQNISSNQVYLNLQLNVHPNIPKLIPNIEELPSSDLPFIKDHIIKWNESYNHSFPSRKFSALAINSSGKTTSLVRYIRALEPPQLNNEGFDLDPDQCAKFVSLIPFTNCNHFYQNVWLSTDQLLHLLCGSIVDHAVALTCLLLSLKLDVCLLLGFGIPHGTTAYVLQCEHSKETDLPLFYIYDVVSGDKINVLDPYCPLQRVYCVVKEQNIWANVQRSDTISLTRFDFTRKSDWLPLFNSDVTAPTNSVHNKIFYIEKLSTEELELQLERKIKKLVSKSRPMKRTIWNKRVSNVIKNNIHLLDYVFMHGRTNKEISNELVRSINEYDVSGYILNLPYTNFSAICKNIKMYGVHVLECSDFEFSLAVQIEAQPSFVASVWIFLAVVKAK